MKRPAFLTPKVLTAILILALVAVIWFAGPPLGLTSPEIRFALIFLLMLLWVIGLMVGKALSERSSRLLERMLRRNADEAVIAASPEKRAEMAQLRKRLLGAIDTLKKSKLGRGRAALYELPWYLLLGHPAAGKSCAITCSGLTFPFAQKGGPAVQGIGGTRDCDWFFSTEGVLLDTAGRYASDRNDRPEWLEFLRLLRRHRSRAPLNGILVGLSLPELQRAHTDSFAACARQIRQRIHEAEQVFGMKLPVYLVVTKMDLLPGFAQFFEDFSEEDRRQTWGASLPHEQGTGFDPLKTIGRHFDELGRGLVQTGTDRLATSRSNLTRPALFSFPLEFSGLKANLLRFTELLVEEDPYHNRPLIRGFYFTSALQSGQPEQAMAQRIARQFGLPEAAPATPQEVPHRAYFLEGLFRKVIFPDRFLVGRGSHPRRTRNRLLALGAGVALLALVTGAFALSYVMNQKLVGAAAQEMQLATSILHSDPSVGTRLRALQLLQARIELLQRYRREGAPWSLRWGLYRGKDVEGILRAEYDQGLRALMLAPVQMQLERRLEAFLAAPGSALPADAAGLPSGSPQETAYNALKTYLMLQQQSRMEASHLTDQLPRYWAPWLEERAPDTPVQDLRRMAERTVAFYVSQIAAPRLPVIEPRMDLVQRVRQRLAGDILALSPFERIYNEIKSRANTAHPALSVGQILENRDTDLVAGSSQVAGSFTLAGWNGTIRTSIQKAAQGKWDGTDWVLASAVDQDLTRFGRPEENEARLLSLYRADYIREWERFLQGIAIQTFDSPDKAADGLGRLGDPQRSPIRRLFARAAQETAWDNPVPQGAADQARNQVFERTSRFLGGGTSSTPTGGGLGEVGGRFAFLGQLTTASNGRAPIEAYLELLLKLKGRLAGLQASGDPAHAACQFLQGTVSGSGSELAEAQAFVDNTLLAQASESSRAVARPLLLRPLTQSCQSLIPLVEQDLNRAWSQQVLSQWNNLAGKYPFADAPNEAALGDIVRFLKPGEGALPRFVSQTLGPLVTRRGDSLALRNSGWPEARLNPAAVQSIARLMQAAESILQEGETCRFELQATTTPRIRETLLEIDGQRLQYRNGVESWIPFTWPSPSGSQGARIQVVSNEGASAQVAGFSGRLSLMRLLDSARIENLGGNARLEWRFRVPQSFTSRSAKEPHREETFPSPVRFHFRMVSGANPLKLVALRHHALPSRITS